MFTRKGRRRPTVAIIGRPNVGKSTLFNRLTGRRLAIVHDEPGVTRDIRSAPARLGELRFDLLDTAGLEEGERGSLAARMTALSERAMKEADVILFMTDARAGITPEDEHFARLLRRLGKPVIVLANKAEGELGEAAAQEAWTLGLGEPIALSSAHGLGMDELHDSLEEKFLLLREWRRRDEKRRARGETPTANELDGEEEPRRELANDGGGEGEQEEEEEREACATSPTLRIAIVGRPNAGKSTLVNRLLGQERQLTGPEAGITRDSIAIPWSWRGRRVQLWDTAGMRRKAKVKEKLERLSVGDAIRAAKFAEVVVLLLDATEPLKKQDLAIADLMTREGRALVIAVNKWDLVRGREQYRKDLERAVDRLLPQVIGAPVVTLSALTGRGVDKLMPAVVAVHENWNRRIPTARLNRWLREAVARHPPPAPRGRRIKLRYITQVAARPPTFAVFTQRADEVPEEYGRYLVKALREAFDLWGTPIRLRFREVENPYDDGRAPPRRATSRKKARTPRSSRRR